MVSDETSEEAFAHLMRGCGYRMWFVWKAKGTLH